MVNSGAMNPPRPAAMWQFEHSPLPKKRVSPRLGSPGSGAESPLPSIECTYSATARMEPAPKLRNDGMPVPGTPLRRISVSSFWERFWTTGLVAIFGARWVPLPSKPWQPAQVDANICAPRGGRGEFPVCALEGGFWACPTKEMKITPKLTNPQARLKMGFMDLCDEYFWGTDIGPRLKLLILDKQGLNVKAEPIRPVRATKAASSSALPGRGSSNGVLL